MSDRGKWQRLAPNQIRELFTRNRNRRELKLENFEGCQGQFRENQNHGKVFHSNL